MKKMTKVERNDEMNGRFPQSRWVMEIQGGVELEAMSLGRRSNNGDTFSADKSQS